MFKGLPVARKDVQAVLGGVQAGLAGKLASMAVPALEMAQGQEFADLARRGPESPFAEAHETRRPKKARPGQKQTEANGSNGPPAQGQTDSGSAPDSPPAEANGSNGRLAVEPVASEPSTEGNGSNGKLALEETCGRHQTASNGHTKKKRSPWWGFGQPFRKPANAANRQECR